MLGLKIDLLFFDTTSTYFGGGRRPGRQGREGLPRPGRHRGCRGRGREAGFRAWGKSKDHRDGLLQVVIGIAVTRVGVLVRVWYWPGHTADSALIRQVKDDMRDGPCRRSSGSPTAGSPRRRTAATCAKGGNHDIIGERLRRGGRRPIWQGRYQEVAAANLRVVKEGRIAEGERFVISCNPEGTERGAVIRASMMAQLKELIDGTDALAKDKLAELRGVISTKPGPDCYLRVTAGGLLRVDASKATAQE